MLKTPKFVTRLLSAVEGSNVLEYHNETYDNKGNLLMPEIVGIDLLTHKITASATVADCELAIATIDNEIARLTQARGETVKVLNGANRMLETLSGGLPAPKDNRPRVPVMRHTDINTNPLNAEG